MKGTGILALVVLGISAGAALNQTHPVTPVKSATIIHSHGFESIVEVLTIDNCLEGLKRIKVEEKSGGSALGLIHFQCHSKVNVKGFLNEQAALDRVEQNVGRIFSEHGVALRPDRGHARRSFFKRNGSQGFVSLFVGSPDKESNVYVTMVAAETTTEGH
jgi:hypothetical protein